MKAIWSCFWLIHDVGGVVAYSNEHLLVSLQGVSGVAGPPGGRGSPGRRVSHRGFYPCTQSTLIHLWQFMTTYQVTLHMLMSVVSVVGTERNQGPGGRHWRHGHRRRPCEFTYCWTEIRGWKSLLMTVSKCPQYKCWVCEYTDCWTEMSMSVNTSYMRWGGERLS